MGRGKKDTPQEKEIPPSEPMQDQDKHKKEEQTAAQKSHDHYILLALQRLKTMVEGDKKLMVSQKPEKRKHIPYVYNDLAPYVDLGLACHVIEKIQDIPDTRPSTRNTAAGLVDPEISLNMDEISPQEDKFIQKHDETNYNSSKREDRPHKRQHKGSTQCPKYPAVLPPPPNLRRKYLDYSMVTDYRKAVTKFYAQTDNEREYIRTKDDFYRMELDHLHEVPKSIRGNLKKVYTAYLHNNPGSKRALKECLQEWEKQQEAKRQVKQEKFDEATKQYEETNAKAAE